VINIMTGVPNATGDDIQPNNRRYVVAGTFRTGENETDLSTVYLPRSELVSLLGTPTQYDTVLVKLKDYARDGEAVRDDLREGLYSKGLIRDRHSSEVRTWEEFRGTLLGAIENEKTLMSIMLSLVVVVAGFTVFAILSMMVTEKRRDIGILSALGATPAGIHVLFVLIGFWDALIGATLGAIIGTWAAFKIDAIERWLSDTFSIQIFNRDVYLFDHIPSVVEPVGVALIVLGAFVCTLLFASIPAWKAGRLHPLDALRYE
jgi:lipoprotein-releasing system permease protein